jgi:mycothiol synthase
MRIRPPTRDDVSAVLAVLVARDLADLGRSEYSLGDLQDEWRAPDFDLSADARVVEADRRIVAYATVQRHGSLAVVAPDHEGRGAGALLLKWVERRERDRGADRHRQWTAASNTRARELLSAAGYRPVRSYARMVRKLDHLPAAEAPPPGVRLRPVYVERDAAALYALDASSFASSPDYVPEPLEVFVAEHLHAHNFDSALSRVVEEDEQIVGFALVRRSEERVGFIDILAVEPSHQRRGLGTLLLLSTFAAFAAAGLEEAQLGVASDNPRGLRLYERAGMTARYQFDVYERPFSVTHDPAGRACGGGR